jgi:hypothetical protein
MSRARALAGVAGPAAFAATWVYLGATTRGYSPVAEPVSHLAAARKLTQRMMTAGLIAVGLGIGAYSSELRRALPGHAGTAALVTAAATIGIAATPMESSVGGAPHVVAAGLTYASLAATPLLASRSLSDEHRHGVGVATMAGVAAGACLAASVGTKKRTGLWQRLGFTIGHTWIAASAVWLSRRHAA